MDTIAFFWIGDDINIPQNLVRSIRLVMGNNINIVQLTNFHTQKIEGVNSVKHFKLSRQIMIARLEAYSKFETETDNTFFCDTDTIFVNKLTIPSSSDKKIYLSPRHQNFKINYNYPEFYEEFVGKTLNEVMPFLFCAILTKGNQQTFFNNLLDVCVNLPERFHRWYGDQYALFLYTKNSLESFDFLDPNIYQYEVRKPLLKENLKNIISKNIQMLHFKGPYSKVHIPRSVGLLAELHK